MRRIVTFIIITIMINGLNAQSNFEGTIVYNIISGDSTLQMKLTAWFTKDKIKTVTEVIKAPSEGSAKNETIVLDFARAAIDRVKMGEKKIERELMTRKDIPFLKITDKSRMILDHPCKGYTTGKFTNNKEGGADKTVKNEKEVTLWYSDDLVFKIPDSLKMIQMVPMFTNGNIALCSEIRFLFGEYSFLLKTEAVSISPAKKTLPASIFRYPEGYPLIHNE